MPPATLLPVRCEALCVLVPTERGLRSTSIGPSCCGLLLAARKGDDLVYVESVGTGFTENEARTLRATMDKLVSEKPQVAYEGRRKNGF